MTDCRSSSKQAIASYTETAMRNVFRLPMMITKAYVDVLDYCQVVRAHEFGGREAMTPVANLQSDVPFTKTWSSF